MKTLISNFILIRGTRQIYWCLVTDKTQGYVIPSLILRLKAEGIMVGDVSNYIICTGLLNTIKIRKPLDDKKCLSKSAHV